MPRSKHSQKDPIRGDQIAKAISQAYGRIPLSVRYRAADAAMAVVMEWAANPRANYRTWYLKSQAEIDAAPEPEDWFG